ncbi:hypothetical protein [Streptococcus acidominimus]|uniref:Uncharacterized protein n=1 Tax=Streptococcus acidominimus TaxID=1326 RepID=A0A380IAP2_STRAI|nr:hypothetical protein [Streptococcus acidominimus]QBX13672.1 hypothetical protein Javan1_0032 [Streptococcus phage Javan1]SUN05084.1 Uncharacterised protein [Streptococcus acidominimus]
MEKRIEGNFTGITTSPAMITIPKSEYDLLVEIKNKFLGVNNHEQTKEKKA